MADFVLLADAAADAAAIAVSLTARLATYAVTLDALSITAEGAFEQVSFGGVPSQIDMPGGWRGRGHLTGDPVNYLMLMALDRLGIEA